MWTSNKNNEQCALLLDSMQSLNSVWVALVKHIKKMHGTVTAVAVATGVGKVLVEKYPLISRHKSAMQETLSDSDFDSARSQ